MHRIAKIFALLRNRLYFINGDLETSTPQFKVFIPIPLHSAVLLIAAGYPFRQNPLIDLTEFG